MSEPYRILFVCLGNICRSPTAEGVTIKLIKERGLAEQIEVDSAGTGDWHIDQLADVRSRTEAANHGVHLTHRARLVEPEDFSRFDLVLAMDKDNLSGLEYFRPTNSKASVRLFRSFDPLAEEEAEVPDPYFGGDDGFAHVFEMCERTANSLLDYVVGEL